MYGLPDRLRPLSAAEEQVMLAVWACREPATRRDIDEKLRSKGLSLIHISEPTRLASVSRMPSSA